MKAHNLGREAFASLLAHVAIDEQLRQALKGGELVRLEVWRKKRLWRVHVRFDRLLAPEAYRAFLQALRARFADLAAVDLCLSYREPVDPAAAVAAYWPVVVEEAFVDCPTLAAALSPCQPAVDGHVVRVGVPNDVVLGHVKRKGADRLLAARLADLTGLTLAFRFAVEETGEALEAFRERREQEERELVEAALRAEDARQREATAAAKAARAEEEDEAVLYGYAIGDEPVPLKAVQEEARRVVVQGCVFDVETRELKTGRTLVTFKLTDYTDSILVKAFARDKEELARLSGIAEGMWVRVRGSAQLDPFVRDLVLNASDINRAEAPERRDTAEEKRVELHLHTPMSAMDAVTPVKKLVERAAKWGHPAIAITDHGVCQAFPEAYEAGQKYGVKILYGMEAYLVDDGVPIVYKAAPRPLLDDTYVVFDIETTGLSSVDDRIIEIAAVKVHKGEIVDRFESFVNPHRTISPKIQQLTGITNEMVKDAPELDEVLVRFRAFVGDAVLVAHNARFDTGFLAVNYRRIGQEPLASPVLDTLELARALYPNLRNHRLNTLCEKFGIPLVQHHRAVYDAEATGYLLWKMLLDAKERGYDTLDALNRLVGTGDVSRQRPFHATLLVQNAAGLKNLYKLISLSHLKYFHRTPRIPRSVLLEHRDGLLVGSACDQGEVFEAAMHKSEDELEEVAAFYDYLEIQPVANYRHLIDKDLVRDEEHLRDILRKIVRVGEKLGKPVVATGNVHYLDPHDEVYRRILVHALGGASPLDPDRLPPVYFRTTDEMLEAFAFLGEEKAREVVITNTRRIADSIEDLKPFPDELHAPVIEGADEEIRRMAYETARRIYGDPLPEIVEQRLEKELNSIINHGYAVIYLISHKIVNKSLEDGYLVGSRGSVGSSFVATMTRITEVNPLPPHYVCPSCHFSEFFTDGSVGSGFDLPDKDCPRCGTKLKKDGHDIPFETFMGFKGDKVPDIDLNFSGEYQPIAHKYTETLFGKDYVYRAGTISTVADKTAYGYVMKYMEEKGLKLRQAEIDRLARGCTGVKRTTGQHPGGLMVIPQDKEVYDFTPIQHPADDPDAGTITTHFDYHAISGRLLKLDILGHDDPTVLRMLQDLTGINPKEVPVDDPKVLGIFSSTEPLGVTPEEIGTNVGTLGIPEFGTKFVRQMLEDTRPKTFAELVRISGLSHGTDVWLNNAQDLIRSGTAKLSEVISTRDDIMVYLIQKGMEPSLAFKIMERVRKGKGLGDEEIQAMREHGVPEWYIASCQKIKYMFPKAHAVAYVLMAVRIAWFKVYRPIEFYATYFTVRADDIDLALVRRGPDAVREKIRELNEKGASATPKEKNLLTILEMCLEMLARGFSFQNIDLYRSDATRYLVDGNTLIPPFNALPGVGTAAAKAIVEAREEGPFLSVEDLQQRARVSRAVIDLLAEQGILRDLPETNQLSLF